jgi:hypothetical protein
MVRHIVYKEKKYPLRIGYKALKGVVGEIGREFNGDGQSFDFEGAEALLFHAMKQGCAFTGQDFDLVRDQMEDVLEESLQDFIAAFTAFSQPPETEGAKPEEA